MRYVYFVRQQSTDYYKIGIATNLKSRIAGIQTGSPNPIELIWKKGYTNATSVEKAVHAYFMKYRVQGEWFKFDSVQRKDVISFLEDLHTDSDEDDISYNGPKLRVNLFCLYGCSIRVIVDPCDIPPLVCHKHKEIFYPGGE